MNPSGIADSPDLPPLYHRFDFESATHMESQTQQSCSDARYLVGSVLHLYVDLIFISMIILLMSPIAMEFISPLSSPSRFGACIRLNLLSWQYLCLFDTSFDETLGTYYSVGPCFFAQLGFDHATCDGALLENLCALGTS